MFEKGQQWALAAQAIDQGVGAVDDKLARAALLTHLGELRDKLNEPDSAADAYAEAAELTENPKLWEAAERAFTAAARWSDAAHALDERAELVGDPKQQAVLAAKAAILYGQAGDEGLAITRLERATELEPTNDEFAQALETRYTEASQWVELVQHLLGRFGQTFGPRSKRIALRKAAAAALQRERLDDADAARESLRQVLQDGDEEETLALLAEDAQVRCDYTEAVALLRRLGSTAGDAGTRCQARLHEAEILAEHLEDPEGAIRRYQSVLDELDHDNVTALLAIASLEEARENVKGAVEALERLVALSEGETRADFARRVASFYEERLEDPSAAIRALETVIATEEDDFASIARLVRLCEQVEEWSRAAELLRRLIEVEGDEAETSTLLRRLATILDEHLRQGDEALRALEPLADAGDVLCRQAYIALGDKLEQPGLVASKLVTWNETAGASPERNEALRQAFQRFVAIARADDAIGVALDLDRSKGLDDARRAAA